jgi:LysM repeat protein
MLARRGKPLRTLSLRWKLAEHRAERSAQPDQSFLSAFVRKAGMVGMMKRFRPVTVLFAACIVSLTSVVTAQGSDLAREYEQVKKIALKDPKVRAAFDKANHALDRRMIEIYPGLRPFIEAQRARIKRSEKTARSSVVIPESAGSATHIVAKGETLTSIAKRYKLSVNSLAKANSIAKEGTLKISQTLVIPSRP